jgi:hypothetical protein
MSMPYKACPRCQTPAALACPRCEHCGHFYRTEFAPPDQTQMHYGPRPHPYNPGSTDHAGEPAKVGLIAAMWILTAISMLGSSGGSSMAPYPFLIDMGACAIAIMLVCSPNRSDKWNGVVKLSIEGVAFLLGFAGAFAVRSNGY